MELMGGQGLRDNFRQLPILSLKAGLGDKTGEVCQR